MRVMFDSNAYDAILHHDDAERIEAELFSIITTAAQEDELHQIADPARRAALLDVFHRLHAATAEISADWDAARDSIIGKAAAETCDLLVTDDRTLTEELARSAPALHVLTYENFRKECLL